MSVRNVVGTADLHAANLPAGGTREELRDPHFEKRTTDRREQRDGGQCRPPAVARPGGRLFGRPERKPHRKRRRRTRQRFRSLRPNGKRGTRPRLDAFRRIPGANQLQAIGGTARSRRSQCADRYRGFRSGTDRRILQLRTAENPAEKFSLRRLAVERAAADRRSPLPDR